MLPPRFHRLFGLAMLLTAGGCAGLGPPPGPPYAGLSRTSYGPLQPITPRSCSPHDPAVGELSRQITALIAKPFSGISKVDPSIKSEGLEDKFRIPGDPSTPPVSILERSKNGVVFRHDLDLVPMSEVADAAATFCEHQGGQSVWEGSAEQCGTPSQVGFAINGQQPVVIPSQVISSYRCVADRPAGRQRTRRS